MAPYEGREAWEIIGDYFAAFTDPDWRLDAWEADDPRFNEEPLEDYGDWQ